MPKADWGSGTSGALGGASTGAAIGSIIPGVGTAIGAGVGGLIGGFSGLFGGKKKKKKVSAFDKNQQKLNQQQHQAILGKGPLADLYNYDPEAANQVFDQNIANPAYRKFQENVIPGITGQFRSNGLMNSSYAGDAISKLARDIQESLNSQRTQYLYGEQKDAQNAKREAVNSLQNQQTFAYDKNPGGGGGFDINKVLNSITPDMIDQAKNYFNPAAAKP